MQVLLLILFTIVAISSSCQQPVERQTPDWDQTGQQLPLPLPSPAGSPTPTPTPTPSPTHDDDDNNDSDRRKHQELSDDNSVYKFVDEVKYLAGSYARSIVYVSDQDGNHFNLEVTFTAEEDDAVRRKKVQSYCQERAGDKCQWKYPTFIVTMPVGSYQQGEHTNPQHFRSGSPYVSRDELHIETNNMKKGNSFRLIFKVLKSALTNGQLNTSFNLQFDSPHFDQVQFKSDNDETPSDGSFPLE